MKKVNIGIIGYGSMGKMLFDAFRMSSNETVGAVLVTNRTMEKLHHLPASYICTSNSEAALKSDLVFLCVRPTDLKSVLEDIAPAVTSKKLVISLNGSVSFSTMERIISCKMAKVIPSVTAEVKKSQTLVCYNEQVPQDEKDTLEALLQVIGNSIELPENEMGMGSELVSCMPGFIASIFDVICRSAKQHTEIPEEQIVDMVLHTMTATASLMLEKHMSFEQVVQRVATKGGITQEGTTVVYDQFPETADDLFRKTMEKRRLTAEKAELAF